MMGRAVTALCLLTSTAFACPDRAAAVEHRTDDAIGVAIAFTLMGLCVFAYTITRANAVRRTFATSRQLVDVDIDALRRVATEQRTRTARFALGCAAVVTVIMQLPVQVETKIGFAAIPAIVMIICVIAASQLQLLTWLRPEPSLRVASHGDYMFVSRNNRLVGWVAAPTTLLSRVSGLPTAKLRG